MDLSAMAENSRLSVLDSALTSPPVGEGEHLPFYQRFSLLRRHLATELNPLGRVEHHLVDEIARRAAQLQSIDDATAALEAAAAQPLLGVGLGTDAATVSIVGSARYASLSALSMGAARSLHRALGLLQLYRQNTYLGREAFFALPDARFATEVRCFAHLIRRYQTGEAHCQNCHGTVEGYWIASRRAWECGRCGRQTGVRHGTVAAESAIPLVQWFHGIKNILVYPSMSTADLARYIGISRMQTARNMAKKIRAAGHEANASELLAGLDELFLGT